MKNFISFFKAQLFLMVVLFSVTVSYAQTVSVPVGCTVVIPGVGGTVGANPIGKVGEGGKVAMPDPSGGGNFVFNVPVVIPAVTTAGWSLKGDLSNTNVTPNITPLQPPAGLSAKIFTCNKNPRSSEGLAPSLITWARSKGQVKVSWAEGTCGKTLTFEVFKSFSSTPITNVPKIVGPSCLKPNTLYTYSVDQIVSDNANDAIGFDSYYWSGIPAAYLSPNPSFYTSADGSSITFATGATVSPINLQVCYGRVNPTTVNVDGGPSFFLTTPTGTHSTCISKTLVLEPTAPTYVTPPPTCLATNVPNTSSFTVVYPNVIGGLTYTWTAPNTGWTLSTNVGATNTTLTVNTNGNLNPGTLVLTITGSCDPVTINYQINRSITAPFVVTPTVVGNTCLNSTSSNNTYTLNPVPGGNNIEWVTIPGTNPLTAPAAVPGVTLVNASTATVTVNTTGATGNFLLVARSNVAACNGTFVYLQIDLRPAAPVFTATSPSCVPLSSPALTTFAVSPVAGASSYTWTLPAGWSNTGTVAQQTSVNPILVPPVNNSILNAPALPPATISVTANSATGCSSAATNFPVNYVRITANALQGGAGNCDQYSINNAAPCALTIANWTVNGVTAVNTPGLVNIFGNTLTLCGNTPPSPPAGSVCANVVINGVTYNTCSSTVATGTHGLTRQSNPSNATLNTTPKEVIKDVTIFPNPNSGRFVINVLDFSVNASATLTDFSGNEIKTYQLNKGDNEIVNDNLKNGTYFIILHIDGKQEARQIIIK